MADADDQSIGQFAFEDLHQRQCGFVVELVGGFVEEQDLRFVQQCAGKAEPLLFAALTGGSAIPFRYPSRRSDGLILPVPMPSEGRGCLYVRHSGSWRFDAGLRREDRGVVVETMFRLLM